MADTKDDGDQIPKDIRALFDVELDPDQLNAQVPSSELYQMNYPAGKTLQPFMIGCGIKNGRLNVFFDRPLAGFELERDDALKLVQRMTLTVKELFK